MVTLFFKKIILMLVLIIMAISAVIAVSAYSSVTVQSPVNFKITTSDQALLALIPGVDPAGLINITESGVLEFKFSFDTTNEQVFNFDNLFYVKNNLSRPIDFTVKCEGIEYINLKPPKGSYFIKNGANTGTYFTLHAGSKTPIQVSFTVPAGIDSNDMDGSLIIEAKSNPD